MGSGFRFKCNNCGGEYTVLLGVGFAFPSEYEKVNERYGTTMLIVTHNNAIKNMVDQVIIMKDGEIRRNYMNEEKISASELEDL